MQESICGNKISQNKQKVVVKIHAVIRVSAVKNITLQFLFYISCGNHHFLTHINHVKYQQLSHLDLDLIHQIRSDSDVLLSETAKYGVICSQSHCNV